MNALKCFTDCADITFMLELRQERGITLDLRGDSEINSSAKKGFNVFLKGQDVDTIKLAESVVLR